MAERGTTMAETPARARALMSEDSESRAQAALIASLHRLSVHGDMGQFIEQVLAEIEHAKHRVLLECFIVRADALGRRLAASLSRAAARGVTAELLYDPMGCRTTASSFFEELRAAGV